MRIPALVLLLCGACAANSSTSSDAGAEADAGLCAQAPAGRVQLPTDDTVHGTEPMEWWYWTGHLQNDAGRWFGFELVFFRATSGGFRVKMAHAAVTDIENGGFHYLAKTEVGDWTPVADGYSFAMSNQTASGGNGRDRLHGEVDGYVLDLDLVADKAPVLQNEVGYTDYSFGGYTYYYSREHMPASGTLVINGQKMNVHGTGWFDHQYGDIQSALTAGWDWYALQLDDNRQIMLFEVRKNGQQVLVGGSMSDGSCRQIAIPQGDVTVTALGDWRSPNTGCTYPSGWTVKVGQETFTVTPTLRDQELGNAFPVKYWEGACTVSGSATGRAYVELTGYCK